MARRIYKYRKGQDVPEGAEYLWSYREADLMAPKGYWIWHYFVVQNNPKHYE